MTQIPSYVGRSKVSLMQIFNEHEEQMVLFYVLVMVIFVLGLNRLIFIGFEQLYEFIFKSLFFSSLTSVAAAPRWLFDGWLGLKKKIRYCHAG